MKKQPFQPIRISENNPNQVFENHRTQLAKAIVCAIEHALKRKRKKIDFAEINVKDILIIALSIRSDEFSELLTDNLKILEEVEEYELCALALKLKNKIDKQNEKVTQKD